MPIGYPDGIDELHLFTSGQVIDAARVNELQSAIENYERYNLSPWQAGLFASSVTAFEERVLPWRFYGYYITLNVPLSRPNGWSAPSTTVSHTIPRDRVPYWVSQDPFERLAYLIMGHWIPPCNRPFSFRVSGSTIWVVALTTDNISPKLDNPSTELALTILFMG